MLTVSRLYDPNSNFISKNNSRCVFTIPAGTLVNSKKIKLINFTFENVDGTSLYYGPRGVWETVKTMSITSLKGTTIDTLRNRGGLDVTGIYHLGRFDNGQTYSIGRQVNENMATSIFVESPSEISLTEVEARGKAESMEITLDLSSMSQYLQARTCIYEGFNLIIEWEDTVGNTLRLKNNKPPVLCLNEFLDPKILEAEKNDMVEFNTLIQDRFYIGINSTGITTRMNAFFNQYINRLWYFNVFEDKENGMAYYSDGEKMNVFIDSKQFLTLQGNDTWAKKTSMLTDAYNELTIPNGVSQNLNYPLGLYNPNIQTAHELSEGYNKIFSYGCMELRKWIGNDITITYTQEAKAFVCYLYVVAEVARTYSKSKDQVGYMTVQATLAREAGKK